VLPSLELKRAYSSDYDDILYDFYIPALEETIEYDRLAGFFSSSTLAAAAAGILGLINNKGQMNLVTSTRLTQEDLNEILVAKKNPEKYLEEFMLRELDNKDMENEFINNHVRALGWMLANMKLSIKVAVCYNNMGEIIDYEEADEKGIFHQKVGILKDSIGNVVTFSGSVNETASGWLGNIEEFKVFTSWNEIENEYVKTDIEKFNRFWNNNAQFVKVFDIPKAVEHRLIQLAPKDIGDLKLERWHKKIKRRKARLFQYQKDAIEKWIENGMHGIFEMATGTGKTYTALGCLDEVNKRTNKTLAVITCPYQHLVQQWKREIEKYGVDFDLLIVADSSNKNWKNQLADSLIDISLGFKSKIIVLTTHDTFSSNAFLTILAQNKNDTPYLIIGDEVHSVGSPQLKRGLQHYYDYRLGLSATPRRWFDEAGTKFLFEYFGSTVFEFDLSDALTKINPITGQTFLTPYIYEPTFVFLNDKEMDDYLETTKSIFKNFSNSKNNDERNSHLEHLLFKRANIIKNAQDKYFALEKFLDNNDGLRRTIIYCSPEQIDAVFKSVVQRGIVAHTFTMSEGTKPDANLQGLSQRSYILNKFSEGRYQVLVAIKCLDEGVDIPQASQALFMASSGNPREYIQRIGRVIRRYHGKEIAVINDFIVFPFRNGVPEERNQMEKIIFEQEQTRYFEIARLSVNNAFALSKLYQFKDRVWGKA